MYAYSLGTLFIALITSLIAHGEQDSAFPRVQYEIGSPRGYVDITQDSAVNGITHLSDLKNASCAKMLAPIIDETKTRTGTPLLDKFTKQGDFHSSHTLTIVSWFDVFGNLGPGNVNSNRCTLHVQAQEGPLAAPDSAAVFTYVAGEVSGVKVPGSKLLPYSQNPGITQQEYLVQHIMTQAYPAIIQFLKEDIAYKQKMHPGRYKQSPPHQLEDTGVH